MKNKLSKKKFKPYFKVYWDYIKDVIDDEGWVYTKEVPHLLDAYFEMNTGTPIDFEKSYAGEWKGPRWRPKAISEMLKEG
jgi:hypothetical protein